MKTSNFNLISIQTEELSKHIAASIQARSNIMIFGRRGSGKTEICKQEVRKSGCKEIYCNLSTQERVDIGGYPDVMGKVDSSKYVSYLLPRMYEHLIEGPDSVVLFDEVDKADPSILAPLLEFVQFHTINGKHLPFLRTVLMTGNLLSEGGSKPAAPLLDRCEKYLLEPNAAQWLRWAGNEGKIHPAVTAYITDNVADLYGEIDPGERYADQSPRSWTAASNLSYLGEKYGWDVEIINSKVCGCIGNEMGLKYKVYYDNYKVILPTVEAIFSGKIKKNEFGRLTATEQLVCVMTVCSRIASMLDTNDETFKKVSANVCKFLSFAEIEQVLVSVRCQISSERLVKHKLLEDKDWRGVLDQIKNEVLGSKAA